MAMDLSNVKHKLAGIDSVSYYDMLDANRKKALDQQYSVGNPQRLQIFKETAARDMMSSKLNDAYNQWLSTGSKGADGKMHPYENQIYNVTNNPIERRWLLDRATGKGMDEISKYLNPSEQAVHNANVANGTTNGTTGTTSGGTTTTGSTNSALTARQQSAIAGLEQQKKQYGQQIASQKGQTDVASAQNANKLRELMANAGLTSSGENVTANVGLRTAQQNALNALDQQHNNYNAQINAQEQGVLNDLSGQDFAQRMAQQQFDWQKQQGQFQNEMNQAQMTGYYNNPAAQQLAQQLVNLQKQANAGGLSQSALNDIYSQSNAIRQQLGSVGVNINDLIPKGSSWQDSAQRINNMPFYTPTMQNQQWQQQQQNWQSQQDWQKYTYDHMSAAQKAQFDQDAKQFGQSMAWNKLQLDHGDLVAEAQAKASADSYQNLINQLGGNFPNNLGGGGNASVKGLINNSASKYKLNPQLLNAVIKTESNFNTNAKSSAGAYGLMQLMPWAGDARYDPASNVDTGSKFLSSLIHKYGDVRLALAAYNAGPGRVDFALQKAHSSNWSAVSKFLPSETRNYVPKVLDNM